MLSRILALAATLLAFIASPAAAQQPQDIVLTVSGAIENGPIRQFSIADLREIEARTVTTTTNWTQGVKEFVGISLDTLMQEVGANGDVIAASALNDYTIEIPMSDAEPGGPIIAFEMDGEPMSRREKGPLWLVYPFDSAPQYRTEVIYARSIWQLQRIEVK